MSRMTKFGLLAGATALTVTGVGMASTTTDATTQQMEQRIQQLERQLAEIKGQDTQLNEQRAAEVRAIVQDVLADADTRASLLGSSMAAGYDDGFTISSGDGNFHLRVNGQLQTRWIWSFQSDGAGEDLDRHRSGFENSRAKLWFTGHVVNPQWQYHLETGFNDGEGDWGLLDAYVTYDYGDGISITAGQFKAPLLREELVDSRYQQAVERSIVNTIFTGGRTQGLMFTFEQDQFRLMGSWNEGANQANTTWDTGPGPATEGSTEFSFTARGEFLAAGNWDQFKEFRSAPGEEQGIMIGGALHWQKDEFGTAFANETEVFVLTADATAKFGGFNAFGAFIYRHLSPQNGSQDQFGILVQGGYHLTDEWEIFGRFEWADLDTTGVDDVIVLTGGVNHYFAGHQAKFTADLGYAFDRIDIEGTERTGFRQDTGGDDGQFVIRTQLQLLF